MAPKSLRLEFERFRRKAPSLGEGQLDVSSDAQEHTRCIAGRGCQRTDRPHDCSSEFVCLLASAATRQSELWSYRDQISCGHQRRWTQAVTELASHPIDKPRNDLKIFAADICPLIAH